MKRALAEPVEVRRGVAIVLHDWSTPRTTGALQRPEIDDAGEPRTYSGGTWLLTCGAVV